MVSMKSDGTKNVSILFFNWFLIMLSEMYLPIIAIFLSGFLVGCVLKKFLSVNGVLICFTSVNTLGNGAKYPRSWNIIRFFAGLFLLARIGIRQRYLMTLLYRMRSGFRWFIFLCIFRDSRKFPIPVINPRYFTNFPIGHHGTVHQHNSISYPCGSSNALTSLIYVSIPPILLMKSDTISTFLTCLPARAWKRTIRLSFE